MTREEKFEIYKIALEQALNYIRYYSEYYQCPATEDDIKRDIKYRYNAACELWEELNAPLEKETADDTD